MAHGVQLQSLSDPRGSDWVLNKWKGITIRGIHALAYLQNRLASKFEAFEQRL